MRLSVIDLGTNSVRFDVHQLGPGARVRTLHREKLMVRLGQGVFTDGRLDAEASRRTLEAFNSFKRTSNEFHANRIVAFGTSALREASDGEKLLASIRKRTGIDVRVISGAEEARLIALGVLKLQKGLPRGKERYGLIDIGGGSTEITLCKGRETIASESFALGTARLQQVFLKSSPPSKAGKKGDLGAIEQLRRHIKSTLLTKMISEDWPKVSRLWASSGTARAIAKLIKETSGGKGKTFDRSQIRKLVQQMSTMTTSQLLMLPGMESKRVDMILAGTILMEECMAAVGARKVELTEYSLRDGILEEQIEMFLKEKGPQIAIRLPLFQEKAVKLGASKSHLETVVNLSNRLFDDLRPVHKLKEGWKPYLTAAAMMHDAGEAITPSRHEEHSYYIVKNADFPSMDPWEIEFVAQLCLHHRGPKNPQPKQLDFGKPKGKTKSQIKNDDKERRLAFLKLLAILRLADALDRGHKNVVELRGVKIDKTAVRLQIAPARNSGIDLELLRIEQKKDLFQSVFERELLAERAGS